MRGQVKRYWMIGFYQGEIYAEPFDRAQDELRRSAPRCDVLPLTGLLPPFGLDST